ncbi:MAG: 5-formyltetrahydrofolate cyclo-ligase, partial [Anaerolineae bacterium]|nr:hypothetical protein [Thermoflexales bacterium]MDW8406504.1 5-formyltetrahydrofolate cyclo-ligase [Anaerolineae bacterium]
TQTGQVKVHRLGYGAGYYDRLLPRLRGDTLKIGLAFAAQRLTDMPVSANDVSLDDVMTEGGLIVGVQ